MPHVDHDHVDNLKYSQERGTGEDEKKITLTFGMDRTLLGILPDCQNISIIFLT